MNGFVHNENKEKKRIRSKQHFIRRSEYLSAIETFVSNFTWGDERKAVYENKQFEMICKALILKF